MKQRKLNQVLPFTMDPNIKDKKGRGYKSPQLVLLG